MANREKIPGLAYLLRCARENAGLSQLQAADRSGVHQVSIARYETDDRVPTLAALYRLAAAYGVAIAELLPLSPKLEPDKPAADKIKKPKP